MPLFASNWPGSEYTCESRAPASSGPGSGLSRMPFTSLKISATDGPVTSVRTLPAMVNGPGVRS